MVYGNGADLGGVLCHIAAEYGPSWLSQRWGPPATVGPAKMGPTRPCGPANVVSLNIVGTAKGPTRPSQARGPTRTSQRWVH